MAVTQSQTVFYWSPGPSFFFDVYIYTRFLVVLHKIIVFELLFSDTSEASTKTEKNRNQIPEECPLRLASVRAQPLSCRALLP